MKIKSIEYCNFRNFAEQGKIEFATDGSMTVIYGTNGDGKTTLHQLFQWILYGKVNFNRTTSADKLYNLEKGKKLSPECSFKVWGQIEFEHNSEDYLVRREWEYYKNKEGDISHKSAGDEFFVQKMNGKEAGKDLDRPNAVIEDVLPSGLAPYFFFDGETMIADLKIRGTDSAKTLKKALHSIFELEIYEKALTDIGSKAKTQSTLGQLERKRKDAQEKATTETKQKEYIRDITILDEKLELIDNENFEYESRLEEYTRRISEISELIGTNKSKKQLERNRGAFVGNISKYDGDIKEKMIGFGGEIDANYAYLLLTGVIQDAKKRLYMQVQSEEKKIIPGLAKELLISLIQDPNHKKCICGHEIGREEIKVLEEWKSYFPPASYKSTYDKFTRNANKFSRSYDEKKLLGYFKDILELKDRIREAEEQIADIDKELSGAGNIDDLISERMDIEKKIKEINNNISENNKRKGEFEHQKKIRERAVQNIENASAEVQKYQGWIELMEGVSTAIRGMLVLETREYSKMLRKEIQDLIDSMLTSKREVFLNEDFQLQVKDSYGDESKSEGQFAVISFAYIGGILKVLKNHEKLSGKEYPLILDGPFSKLDEEQKHNVVTEIPRYAPQVVIFSKDPLEKFVEEGAIGKTWTIQSNDEKNYAVVREGFLWK
ncbi:MAG: AAA family ATPase [Lachnospiraceae bacterium]|nr:AAA family ATPase [Lachnospiraceae bacterium]